MNLRNQKFKKIAEQRMSRIFKSLNSVSKLSNKKYYDYSEDELNDIFDSLIENGEKCKSIFYKQLDRNLFLPSFNFKASNNMNNNKNIKFRELSSARVNNILYDLKLIANLSEKKHYTYSLQEIDYMFESYIEKVENIRIYFLDLTTEFKFLN